MKQTESMCGVHIGTKLAVIAAALGITLAAAAAPAKNVILLIADGWGYSTVEAAGHFLYGDAAGALYTEWTPLALATYAAGSPVYDPEEAWADFKWVMKRATDSAASGTAFATGHRTQSGRIGMLEDETIVPTVAEHAEALGKATGVVSDVMFFHATPAAFLAHAASRNDYALIISQMVHGSAAEVIMGAGHPEYDEDAQPKSEEEIDYSIYGGEGGWKAITSNQAGGDADGDSLPDQWSFIETKEDFLALEEGDTPRRVLGIPRVSSTLQKDRGGDDMADAFEVPFNEDVPTLADMTRAALNVLDNDPDGFFVMIEAGAVDWAGHGNNAGRLIEEMKAFNDAVSAAARWVEQHSSWEETLVIVTGDHETGYVTGPDSDPEWTEVVGKGEGNMPEFQFNSGGHTNQLVPLYVKGAGSELLVEMAGEEDPRRGPYTTNAEVGQALFRALGAPWQPLDGAAAMKAR